MAKGVVVRNLDGAADERQARLGKARAALERACAGMGIDAGVRGKGIWKASGSWQAEGWRDALAFMCEAMGDDGWLSVVGMPQLGWAAMWENGIDLSRCLIVDAPEDKAKQVLSLLLDACAVVLVGPHMAVDGRTQQALGAKAHSSGTLLLSVQPWRGARPQAHRKAV